MSRMDFKNLLESGAGLVRPSAWRSGPVENAEIVAHVRAEGALSGRYIFMTAMSCAIATLGLLLSSPAVIIGAMLISPLMGPIILFGFSLGILDLKALRNALLTLLIGILFALGMSYLIVCVSPLTQATPEIIARTNPNLFDLLVAVFSGLAGGYAVINRKGEAIVGVAIATALMPPLAVTGYGLATDNMRIAGGAFFLFMTNLLAIALSVVVLAKWYGFGRADSPKHAIWQIALIVGTFVALSVPLGLSLKKIAYEANVTLQARAAVQTFFKGEEVRVSDFDIGFGEDPIRIDAIVLTKRYRPDADARLKAAIETEIKQPVALNLDQVLVNQNKSLEAAEILKRAESSLAAPLQSQIAQLTRRDRVSEDLRNAASFKVDAVDLDLQAKTAKIFAAPSQFLMLAAYKEMEAEMGRRYADWTIDVIPPQLSLPTIFFESGADSLTSDAEATIGVIRWALQRWGVDGVAVVGYASTKGEVNRFNNTSLAYRRASAVQAALEALGVTATARSEYRAFNQADLEVDFGLRRFQRVDVRIESAAPP